MAQNIEICNKYHKWHESCYWTKGYNFFLYGDKLGEWPNMLLHMVWNLMGDQKGYVWYKTMRMTKIGWIQYKFGVWPKNLHMKLGWWQFFHMAWNLEGDQKMLYMV